MGRACEREPYRSRLECRGHRRAERRRNRRASSACKRAPASEGEAEMGGAGREVGMVQIIGLHPQRRRARASAASSVSASSLTPRSSTVCAQRRDARLAGMRAMASRAAAAARARDLHAAPYRRPCRSRVSAVSRSRVTRLGRGGRHARMHAQHGAHGRSPRAGRDTAAAARRERQRIAAGEDDLEDLRVRRDIVERRRRPPPESGALAEADRLAAKAEAAIDRAHREQLQQHAVGVAMHEAGQRAEARRRRSDRRAPAAA